MNAKSYMRFWPLAVLLLTMGISTACGQGNKKGTANGTTMGAGGVPACNVGMVGTGGMGMECDASSLCLGPSSPGVPCEKGKFCDGQGNCVAANTVPPVTNCGQEAFCDYLQNIAPGAPCEGDAGAGICDGHGDCIPAPSTCPPTTLTHLCQGVCTSIDTNQQYCGATGWVCFGTPMEVLLRESGGACHDISVCPGCVAAQPGDGLSFTTTSPVDMEDGSQCHWLVFATNVSCFGVCAPSTTATDFFGAVQSNGGQSLTLDSTITGGLTIPSLHCASGEVTVVDCELVPPP